MAALLHPGTELDGFRIERQIHSGGMAVIYSVSGPDAGFPLLMKVPRLGHGEPAESVVSFEVEQMVLSALHGPHVPRFVAAGDLARHPYLVMEHVEGRPLTDWADRAPIPAAEVATLGSAVATALHSLHLQEAIHLDLKPSNVIIRPSGEAVLIDFGLAHHAHYPDLLAEEIRSPIGSAPYIAPEQIMGVRWEPRSDVFALGALLYELATAEMPFGAPTSRGALRQRLWRDPAPPRAIVRDLPEWLQEVILRCLEPDARDRYPSAAQAAFDLANPEEVGVGERGRKTRRDGPLAVFKRYVKAVGYEPGEGPEPTARLAGPSIVLVAIATQHADEPQLDALREAVRRMRAAGGDQRFACITVIKPTSELGGSSEEETATAQRIKHLVILRHWAEPLGLTAGQISFHVIEAGDPADAILKYARMNQVDHIVIGAPPRQVPLRGMLGTVQSTVSSEAAPEPMQLFRLLGTVSTKVAAEAPCSVTVVRARRAQS
ncbi:MAG TPA: bifunctional serine/threonine-protein kinase/universal stress protein [Anaeromyxobacter sp.]|nr:bifunctional serine/threonine-protein kinase/universal stress protein [Anaeromyxobacter sp.]